MSDRASLRSMFERIGHPRTLPGYDSGLATEQQIAPPSNPIRISQHDGPTGDDSPPDNFGEGLLTGPKANGTYSKRSTAWERLPGAMGEGIAARCRPRTLRKSLKSVP